MKKPTRPFVAVHAGILLSFSASATAQLYVGPVDTDASTTITAGDNFNWSTAANWNPATVPNLVDAVVSIAPLTNSSAGIEDVKLDGEFIVGTLNILAPVGVNNAVTTPTAPGTFDLTKGIRYQTSVGNPVVNVAAGTTFWVYHTIFGTQGFSKTGTGAMTFRFNNLDHPYQGSVRINGGTLEIQKDGSLGDPENDLEIAAASKLLANPNVATPTLTLPATRSVTLTGNFAQIGANGTNLRIDGVIGDGVNDFAIDKTDGGDVTLAGANTYSGGSRVSAGVLRAMSPASLPFYDTKLLEVNGTSTLALPFGDGGGWTAGEVSALITNPAAVFGATSYLGIDTALNTGDATFSIATPKFLAKLGTGTLILDTAQPNATAIRVYGGTLKLGLGVANQLPTNLTVNFPATTNSPTLDLGGQSQQILVFNEVSGGTSTITNGSLACTANNTISGNNGTIMDLSGLDAFTSTNSELKLEVGNNVNGTQNSTRFAGSGAGGGTNTITASSRFIVGGGPSAANDTHRHTARFGTVNTINTATFQLGGFNAAGTVNFLDGLVSPGFKVRAANGTAACPNVVIGETSSGGRSGAGTLDLTGGSADILATGIVVGRHIAGSNNGYTNETIIPDGGVTAVNMILAEKVNGGTPTHIANFNQQGGSVTVDSITLGQAGFGAGAVQNLRANYNLEGGTLTAGSLNGFSQVETATAAGTATATGNVQVTVTSADLALLSPLAISVPVVLNDTAATWAGKVVTALNANADVASKFMVAASGASVHLTRRAGGAVDATLNVALANGAPSPGITAAATSADTRTSRVVSNILRTLKLEDGTLINKAGADLPIAGITVDVPLSTTAAADATPGQKIALGSDVTYASHIDSSAAGVGTLQADGDLELAGTLTVTDDAVAAGVVPLGTKLALIDYTGQTLTGTFAGLPEGSIINVGINRFTLSYADSQKVTLTALAVPPYNVWASANGLNPLVPLGAPAGDFDQDGVANMIEYVLVSDPDSGVSQNLPIAQPSGSDLIFTFTRLKEAATAGFISEVEYSETLGSWTTATAGMIGEVDNGTTVTVTATIPVPGGAGKFFARLKVSEPAP